MYLVVLQLPTQKLLTSLVTLVIGYIGGGKAINESVGVYGELSAATNVDDVDWAGKGT